MQAELEKVIMDSKNVDNSSDNIRALVDLIVGGDSLTIGIKPNPQWTSQAPVMLCSKPICLPRFKIDHEGNKIIHPAQPEEGCRWWGEVKFKYNYFVNNKETISTFPAIKLGDCLINLNQRSIEPNLSVYGVHFVEIGIPFTVALNLMTSMNASSDKNCVIAGARFSEDDECCWIDCTLRVGENVEPNSLYMTLVEEHTDMTQGDIDALNERIDFNSKHKCCMDVIDSLTPTVPNIYNCDLILEAYSSVVLPEGSSPRYVPNFELNIKFKVRVVQITSFPV